jgi:hypothetical protein
MKAVLIAFVVALSVSVWSYTKLQRQAGQGNAKSTLQGVALIFVLTFIVVFTLGRSFLH